MKKPANVDLQIDWRRPRLRHDLDFFCIGPMITDADLVLVLRPSRSTGIVGSKDPYLRRPTAIFRLITSSDKSQMVDESTTVFFLLRSVMKIWKLHHVVLHCRPLQTNDDTCTHLLLTWCLEESITGEGRKRDDRFIDIIYVVSFFPLQYRWSGYLSERRAIGKICLMTAHHDFSLRWHQKHWW